VLQSFNCWPWSKLKLLSIWRQKQNVLFYVLERETLIGLGLRYFTMLCNDAEYKNMDQDDLPQAIRLGLLIFYDKLYNSMANQMFQTSLTWAHCAEKMNKKGYLELTHFTSEIGCIDIDLGKQLMILNVRQTHFFQHTVCQIKNWWTPNKTNFEPLSSLLGLLGGGGHISAVHLNVITVT